VHFQSCGSREIPAAIGNEGTNRGREITVQVSSETQSVHSRNGARRGRKPGVEKEEGISAISDPISHQRLSSGAQPEDAAPSPGRGVGGSRRPNGAVLEIFFPHPFNPGDIQPSFDIPEKPEDASRVGVRGPPDAKASFSPREADVLPRNERAPRMFVAEPEETHQPPVQLLVDAHRQHESRGPVEVQSGEDRADEYQAPSIRKKLGLPGMKSVVHRAKKRGAIIGRKPFGGKRQAKVLHGEGAFRDAEEIQNPTPMLNRAPEVHRTLLAVERQTRDGGEGVEDTFESTSIVLVGPEEDHEVISKENVGSVKLPQRDGLQIASGDGVAEEISKKLRGKHKEEGLME